jgi:hypothetical protein
LWCFVLCCDVLCQQLLQDLKKEKPSFHIEHVCSASSLPQQELAGVGNANGVRQDAAVASSIAPCVSTIHTVFLCCITCLMTLVFRCLPCQVIMHNPGHLFHTDPNGFVVPYKPTDAELAAAAVAKKEKAAEAAALESNHGSLFDHLLKNVLNEQPPAAAAPAQGQQQQTVGSESIVEQMNRLHQEQEQLKQQQAEQEAASWQSRPRSGAVASNGNGKQQQQQAMCDMTPKTEEGRQAKAAFLQQFGKEYGYGGLLDQLYPCEVRSCSVLLLFGHLLCCCKCLLRIVRSRQLPCWCSPAAYIVYMRLRAA